jgi:1,4-alpha-glucan branching enzyme
VEATTQINMKQRIEYESAFGIHQGHDQVMVKPQIDPLLVSTTQTSKPAARKVNLFPCYQPVAERFPALEEQEVMIEFVSPTAREVKVAGQFNNWCPESTPLIKIKDGEWVVRLMLRAGEYEYRLVVDGQWIEDPEADQRAANPYGGFNSVLRAPLDVRTSIL